MEQFIVNPIGKIRIDNVGMYIEVSEKYIPALKELDGFSHINVIWWFTDCDFKEAREMLEFSAPYKNAPPVVAYLQQEGPLDQTRSH